MTADAAPCPRDPAIRALMMPRDTNAHGTIFGGVILSRIDQAGAVAAVRLGCRKIVTVAMDKVVFRAPVRVGDLVSLYADVVRTGRTSITVKVEVEARALDDEAPRAVTEAELTYVNVDDAGNPVPIPDQ